MNRLLMYATRSCPYCGAARMLLSQKSIEYDEILIDGDPQKRAEMQARSGRTSVPQIFIGASHVGGYDELAALDRAGELDRQLASN